MAKRQSKKKINNKRLQGLSTTARLWGLVFVMLFAAAGSYLVFGTEAQYNAKPCQNTGGREYDQQAVFNGGQGFNQPHPKTGTCVTNPPLARSCGLDVALLVDVSGSMKGDPLTQAKNAMRSFISSMKDTKTTFTVGTIDKPNSLPAFTEDTATALRAVDNLTASGVSTLNDLTVINRLDPRSDRQNLIIVLSDYEIYYGDSNAAAMKQAGSRVLALAYRQPEAYQGNDGTRYIAGEKVNTGSVLTSDVVTASTNTVGAEFASFAQQLCGVGTGVGGAGNGNGGQGVGTNGIGTGTGPSAGAGAGGGGSLANKQAEQPNPLPASSAQGDAKENPKVEPSPFFDGKQFELGSDRDDQVVGSSTIGKRKITKPVIYVLSVVFLAGTGGALWWWKKRQV